MISHVMTLANGIIGVSVLAMPFCFKQCGIVLASLVLLLSSILSRLACHFLIKSAVMSRRRNFEFLAFHAFGRMGKFLVELSIIGFLLGTCIAFFVVVGDLGPQIIGEMINKKPEDIRTSFLITTGIFIVLPLGLLRNIESLASVSTASIAFYICLVLKVIAESTHHIFAADCFDKVHYWKPGGILQCLPIFALALFCQTQLFEIYEAMPNATLEKMNQVVRGALNICTGVYLCVGFFGYIAFCNQPFTGNILMSFEPSITSEIIKIGFVLSVAFSFPLVIFPCRASLNSLLFRRGYSHETTTSYISETRFRCLTALIVTIALVVGVIIPNIEFVLGIVGSTIGVMICLIFPAAFFISISTKNTNERLLAQVIIFTGMWIMILGTYANLYAMEQSSNSRTTATTIKFPSQINNMPHAMVNDEILIRPDDPKQIDDLLNRKDDVEKPKPKVPDKPLDEENVRQEPPVPVERLPETEKLKEKPDAIILKSLTISPKVQEIVNKMNIDNKLIKEAKMAYDSLKKNKETNEIPLNPETKLDPVKESGKVDTIINQKNDYQKSDDQKSDDQKNDVIAVEAIKKEESELAADKEMSNVDSVQRREQLEKTLEKHIMEQKEMMQEQKELLKDIEQKKKELHFAPKADVDQEKNKNSVAELEKPNDNPIKLPHKVDQEVSKNKDIKNEVKDELQPVKEDVKSLILEEKGPQLDIKNSQNNEAIKNNEIPNDLNEKQIEEKQMNDNKVPKSADTNLNKAPADLLVKESNNPIIKALTKQSNKISNGIEASLIPKEDKKNDINLEDKKIDDKKKEKVNEYSIPIVLKMNNQTKRIPDLKHLKINQSNVEVAAVGRDILENHQREKRMVDTEEIDTPKAALNETAGDQQKDSLAIQKAVIKEEEICSKKEKLQSTKVEQNIEPIELNDETNSNDLIKTSAYLSEQDVVKKVSIDPDLTAGGNFVKLKKRDLKSLKFNNHNEK